MRSGCCAFLIDFNDVADLITVTALALVVLENSVVKLDFLTTCFYFFSILTPKLQLFRRVIPQ